MARRDGDKKKKKVRPEVIDTPLPGTLPTAVLPKKTNTPTKK
jgi:hypothetical protein